jgi:hypothetical protein
LRAGDVFRDTEGRYHYVQYVNSSGAYAVPLAAVTRTIAGQAINFTAGGRTISVYSVVAVIPPLAMGGNSPEYRRYAIMASKSAAIGKGATLSDDFQGVTYGEFDETELVEGHTTELDAATAPTEEGKVAKKAKAKANGAAKAKAPKEVRNCVCGCGTETTGYFAPGHDARYHGWVKKLADGRIGRNGKDAKSGEQTVSMSLLNKMGLVASGDGFKAKTAEFYKD